MTDIRQDIPNWKRFCEAYPKESELILKFEKRYREMPEGSQKSRLAKLVNVELGIALLRETEIDRETLSKMLSAIAK